MGSDDLFKKKRARLKERKKELRTPKPNSFLIVSEGTKTEPLYFDGIAEYINQKYGKSINIEKPIITTQGEGKNTVSLVEAAARTVARSQIRYSQVWVVFDKDDFINFDEAIQLAQRNEFHAAWSNQSFEYWIFLHFQYSDSALHRDEWLKKLNDLFIDRGIDVNGYQKNNPDIFQIVTTQGSLKSAVNNAARVERNYNMNLKPSMCDPSTTVHHLILELKQYINELL